MDRVSVSHRIIVGKCWVSRKTCVSLSNPYQTGFYNKTVLIIFTGSKYGLVIQYKLHNSQGMGSCILITLLTYRRMQSTEVPKGMFDRTIRIQNKNITNGKAKQHKHIINMGKHELQLNRKWEYVLRNGQLSLNLTNM